MTKPSMTGFALATAAAALFSTMGVMHTASAAEEGKVKCEGINSCKGTTHCKTATNACKGQNSCKGHGWLPTASDKECTDKGGKVAKDM